MSDLNFEYSDSNWDETPRESNWSESQWRKYLKDSEQEIERFLSIYNRLKDQPNHLDEIAIQMGWDVKDISLSEELLPAESEPDVDGLFDSDELLPYTLHCHPVIIITRALYRELHQSWEAYMIQGQNDVSAHLCWQYANSLHQAEMNVLFSIQAIDLGDFGLTICHLKNSLNALNQTLAVLPQITHSNPTFLDTIRRDMQIPLFDLREIWIQVIHDCRIESDNS